jgi:hypothetical protein
VTTEEAPGGSTGCDVCGILLVSDKVEVHRAWHRSEEERFDGLTRTIEELLAEVRGSQP